MTWFLKAKHWQLFLLTFGLPFIFQVLMLRAIIHGSSEDAEPTGVLGFLVLYFVVFTLFIIIMYGWLWAVAIGLQHRLPQNVHMKIRKFRRFYNIPIFSAIGFIVFGGALFSLISSGSSPDLQTAFGNFAMIEILLTLLSVFSIGYVIYFAVKTFKSVELQREAVFSDFVIEFLMILIFPIGVWFIQPKINEMTTVGTGRDLSITDLKTPNGDA